MTMVEVSLNHYELHSAFVTKKETKTFSVLLLGKTSGFVLVQLWLHSLELVSQNDSFKMQIISNPWKLTERSGCITAAEDTYSLHGAKSQ